MRRAEQVHRRHPATVNDDDAALAGQRTAFGKQFDRRGARRLAAVRRLLHVGRRCGSRTHGGALQHLVDLAPHRRLIAGAGTAPPHRFRHAGVLRTAHAGRRERLVAPRRPAAPPAPPFQARHGDFQIPEGGHQDADVDGAILLAAEEVLALDDQHRLVPGVAHA